MRYADEAKERVPQTLAVTGDDPPFIVVNGIGGVGKNTFSMSYMACSIRIQLRSLKSANEFIASPVRCLLSPSPPTEGDE